MKYRQPPYWILFAMLIAATSLQAQKQRKDSLYVFGLIATADNFFNASAYDSAFHYNDLAESYCRQQNFKKGLAYVLKQRTDILIDKDELDKAAAYPPTTQAIGLQLKDSLITALAYMQQAQIKMYGRHYEEALVLFDKSIRHYFQHHPSHYAALAYNDQGFTYGALGNLTDKTTSLLRSIQIYEGLGEGYDGDKAATYNNLSVVYYELKQRDKTIEYAKKSIAYREKAGEIDRLSLGCCNLSQFYLGVNQEEALKYQRLCVKYAEQSGDESRIIHAYITSSLIASDQKDYPTSLNYELKVIALLEKSKKDPMMLARRYIAAGMGYSRKDSSLAAGYFNKAFLLASAENDKFNLRDLYYQQALFYKEHHNFELAYNAYNKHILYRDSIVKANTASSVAELETRYESEKKDNLITKLNASQEIKALQIAKQQALLAGNLLEARQKQNEIALLSKAQEVQELKIANQDEQLEKQMLQARNDRQQLELAEQEKQFQEKQLKNSRTVRNLLLTGVLLLSIIGFFLFNRYQLKRKIAEQQSLLTIRNNIARDLHDEIGSTLTSIKILSEVSGRNIDKDSQKASGYLQKITEQSAAAQQGISDIVWAVKPENDRLENMVIRMREYAAQTLESRNILTNIVIDEALLHKTLDMQQRRDLFLIYKEAINNIAKYAQASKVAVTIAQKDHHLLLQVSDNGKGFDTTVTSSSSGLKNMKARATTLSGQLEIRSGAGKGTTVHLEIPIT